MVTSADKVLQYLEEIHALEAGLVSTLGAHIAMTPRGDYRDLLERHQAETHAQALRIEQRLGELGQSSSIVHLVYGTAQTAIGQGLALAMAPLNLLRGTGGEEKLLKNAKDEASSEALEIASYDALEALANAVGDPKTAVLAREHRTQEEAMLASLRELIPSLVSDVVDAEVEGHPHYDVTTTGAADAVRTVAKKTKATARKARGQAEQAAGRATGAAKAVKNDVEGAAETVADDVESAAKAVTTDVKSAAGAVKDDVEDAADAVTSEVKDATGAVKDDVEDAADAVKDDVQEATGGELPIADYDELTVAQILPKLEDLSAEELAVIDGYEVAEKDRKRVVDRISALRTKRVDEQLAKL